MHKVASVDNNKKIMSKKVKEVCSANHNNIILLTINIFK